MAKRKSPEFLPGGLASVRMGLKEIRAGAVGVADPDVIVERIKWIWRRDKPYFPRRAFKKRSGPERVEPPVEPKIPFWLLGMTDEFRRGITTADRKLQGRILVAIVYIARTPVSPKGDTVKALSGELRGKALWRYRIGDYRLVYRVNEQRRLIMLVAFTSRGDAYG